MRVWNWSLLLCSASLVRIHCSAATQTLVSFGLPSDFCEAEINWFHRAYLGVGTESVWLGRNAPHLRQKHLSGRAESQDPLCSNLPPEPDFCGQTNTAKYSQQGFHLLLFYSCLVNIAGAVNTKEPGACLVWQELLLCAQYVIVPEQILWPLDLSRDDIASNSLCCSLGELHCVAMLKQQLKSSQKKKKKLKTS